MTRLESLDSVCLVGLGLMQLRHLNIRVAKTDPGPGAADAAAKPISDAASAATEAEGPEVAAPQEINVGR